MGLFDRKGPEPEVLDKSPASSDEVGYGSVEETKISKVKKISSILTVVVGGLALFSE